MVFKEFHKRETIFFAERRRREEQREEFLARRANFDVILLLPWYQLVPIGIIITQLRFYASTQRTHTRKKIFSRLTAY